MGVFLVGLRFLSMDACRLLTALAMLGVGYHAGLTGTIRSLSSLILAVTFAAVILLVADLDRPQDGMLRVSQQALVDVRATMEESN